jgi:hypothetical protein
MQSVKTRGKGITIQTRKGGRYVVGPDGTAKRAKKRTHRKTRLTVVPPPVIPGPQPETCPGFVTDPAGQPIQDVDMLLKDIQPDEGGDEHADT